MKHPGILAMTCPWIVFSTGEHVFSCLGHHLATMVLKKLLVALKSLANWILLCCLAFVTVSSNI